MNPAIYQDGTTYSHTTTMVCISCYKCHVLFAMTHEQYDRRLKDGGEFFCTNGHGQYFIESENQRLKKQLEHAKAAEERERRWRHSAEADRLHEQRSKNAYRGQLTKIRKRVKHGVCPCCTRHFDNLERHIKSKHPEFQAEPDDQGFAETPLNKFAEAMTALRGNKQ